jgi:hypothetical protein
MTLTAKLASTDVAVAKVLGYLLWCRLYEDGRDITETLTYVKLLDRLSAPKPTYRTRSIRLRRC